jgi:ABC-2 type transport system permease protein
VSDGHATSRLVLNLRALLGRAYPRVIGANREPSWLFFETVLPLLSIAAYVFIWYGMVGSSTNPDAGRYLNDLVGFTILGGTMIAFWLNVLWSMASQLYWEKEIGNLQLYMMAPMSRLALLGGMALGGMFMTSTRAIATLVAGILIFGVTLNLSSPFMIVAVFFVTLVALYGMGMMFASLYLLYGREAWHLSAMMEEPVFLASGFYFPVKALTYVGGAGRIAAFGATIVPATLGLDALRQLIFPGFFAGQFWFFDVEVEFAILLLLAVVFLLLGRLLLGHLEKLAKQEGRLTTRHQ